MRAPRAVAEGQELNLAAEGAFGFELQMKRSSSRDAAKGQEWGGEGQGWER